MRECGGFFLAYFRGLTESLKFKLADAGREVLSIAQGLNSVLPRSRAQRCCGIEKDPEGESDAWKIELFQFCGCLIGVSM
jgi:hypothetical protein